ncbi:MAG: TlpA family protein disulfide reductase [bacterium]|nr:TlpA family protein disulfide reductase [bacterium]
MIGTRSDFSCRCRLPLVLILLAAALPFTGDVAAADQDRGPAPAFTLESTTGERMSLAAALERGPVIVDFWATWCGPCKQSLPELQTLHERYAARGLTILAVSTDEPRNRPKISSTARSLGLTFPILIDADKRAARLYRVESIPMTFLIDREGRIQALHRGFRRGDIEILEQELLPLLDAPAAPAGAPAATPTEPVK